MKSRPSPMADRPLAGVAVEHHGRIEAPAGHSAEAYDHIAEREYSQVADAPLSTFSIDVDTASYANMRRFLTRGHLPPADAIRIEELVNYFSYDYSKPRGDTPFAVNATVACFRYDGRVAPQQIARARLLTRDRRVWIE